MHTSMAPSRNAHGQLLPGHTANPSGRPARRQYRRAIQKLIGEFGEAAYQTIDDIRTGKECFEKLAREPYPDEDKHSVALIPVIKIRPTIRERLDAAQILVEHLNGKPAIDIEVAHEHTRTVRNYDKLPDDELEFLEAMLAKAELPSGDVVEGEIVETP